MRLNLASYSAASYSHFPFHSLVPVDGALKHNKITYTIQ